MGRDKQRQSKGSKAVRWVLGTALSVLLFASGVPTALALTLNVQAPDGTPVSPFRWLLEADNTIEVVPGARVADSISLAIHDSHAHVVARGSSDTATTSIALPTTSPAKRYYISVLPLSGYGNGGTTISFGQTETTVIVQPLPYPTAQFSLYVFMDHNLINNGLDDQDPPLGGATVMLFDYAGQVFYDAFGNLLGTTYLKNPDGSFQKDPEGNPLVDQMGNGAVTTLTQDQFDTPGQNPDNLKVGEALVKYLTPGKYGVRVVPPSVDDDGQAMTWVQTTTIEGTPTIDVWIKANEPELFVEGFGAGFYHAAFGFVKTGPAHSNFKGQVLDMLQWNVEPPVATGSIEGALRVNHFSRPPTLQGFFPGEPAKNAWVGLNNPNAQPAVTPAGLYAAPCDPATGYFKIENVPAGTYTLVTWDEPLDYLFGFNTVEVKEGEDVVLGNVLVFQWFGHIDGKVFYDFNENGFPDPDEPGIDSQGLNLRFRDGSIYQASGTNEAGEYSFPEVFPFFKWLVLEGDFVRYRPTGITAVVDWGGEVLPDDGWDYPSRNKLTPQEQSAGHPPGPPIINPNTGNNLSRTETGEVLTQAVHTFLGQYNEVNWGKVGYGPGENGGISGMVFYDTTRGEDDPRFNAGEEWQPGIPRIQLNLYQDTDQDGYIDNINDPAGIQLADVDNWPFQWTDPDVPGYTGFPAGEDTDHNGNNNFDLGDALQVTTTDSWDDNKPSGCIQDLPVIHGQEVAECADAFGTWNQVRPGLFDGGYAFGGIPTGVYIVEVVPPRTRDAAYQTMYDVVKSQDKNVDFGIPWTPGPEVLEVPPICVGEAYVVTDELSLFPGVEAPLAGQTLWNCNMKQIQVVEGRNAAADFFFKTDVPKTARVVGFANNDLGAEFNAGSPNYGEKLGAPWIPISFRDWAGTEFQRIYSDEFGGYNALVYSTYTMNVPSPSGVSPNMVTMVLNDPFLPDGTLDPYYNPLFSVTPWTFQFYPGVVTYTDTPIVPLAAFSAVGLIIDTDPPDHTPVIASVIGPEPGMVGPLLCDTRPNGSTITLTSLGDTLVLNPEYDPHTPGSVYKITRHYDFGATPGSVTLDGLPLEISSWTPNTIQATVPDPASTGRIMVTRGDNGRTSEIGVTLNIVDCATTTVIAVPGDRDSIQAAIDDPSITGTGGEIILVAPGAYNENVILYKPVRLQGSGGATIINANPNPLERLQTWHDRIRNAPPDGLGGADFITFLNDDPFLQNEAPGIIVVGETPYDGKVFNPGYPFTVPGEAAVDGFFLIGSKAGGGIYAACNAWGLLITNNEITANQGNLAGGIAIGMQGGFDTNNANIVMRHNKIHRNGGVQGGGGISVKAFAANYRIEENLITGNFSRFNGGGINHTGYSAGENFIKRNQLLFNEDFFGFLLNQAGHGGGIFVGGDVAGGTGTGNVTIDANWIQGNLTGSGSGGGIHVFAANGQDVANNPTDPDLWYKIKIFNNMIVNNVAGHAGGGIFLQDVLRSYIYHNTIMNNDSTATSSLSFSPGQANSTPYGAGLVGAVHSPALKGLIPVTELPFSNPDLVNNIIRHNRSWYNDASLNEGAGGLAPNPAGGGYWDLQVLESSGPTDPHLSPVKCFLTQQLDPATGFDYGAPPANYYTDPLVVSPYFNNLEITTLIIEGGNLISVRYTPLMPATGDYHIQAASPVRNMGNNISASGFPPLDYDFDGDKRDLVTPDVGAHEFLSLAFLQGVYLLLLH